MIVYDIRINGTFCAIRGFVCYQRSWRKPVPCGRCSLRFRGGLGKSSVIKADGMFFLKTRLSWIVEMVFEQFDRDVLAQDLYVFAPLKKWKLRGHWFHHHPPPTLSIITTCSWKNVWNGVWTSNCSNKHPMGVLRCQRYHHFITACTLPEIFISTCFTNIWKIKWHLLFKYSFKTLRRICFNISIYVKNRTYFFLWNSLKVCG